ncbi:MAG: hypothetical protein K9K21_12155 [Desulfotignum sp.]|nr:hypothetical protein [Desulfotignum sp.]MCF8139421.1 hypothetical protein [Desulfotignum sp.]
MNWHFHSRAKGLIVSGVLILVVIGLPMGFALNRSGDEMKQDVSIMPCNIGDIVGGNPLDSDEVAGFVRDCGVPDVLLLQEVRGEKEAAYLSRQLNRPGFVFLPDHDSDQLTSKTVRQLCPGFDDVLWPSLDYFKGTYTKLDFPIAPRIDFLFVSAALGRKNARVIPKSPGDHFPVWADILIPG